MEFKNVGYFRNGDELTSGIPDQKEGYYFGTELSDEDPRPLHGKNIFPSDRLGEELKSAVLSYLSHMKALGLIIMHAIMASMGIEEEQIHAKFANPTELFRIFNYPPHDASRFPELSMGVGEHTDYGYITVLWQDYDSGGLQVKSLDERTWIDAPPILGTFVINLGDALEHATGGLCRATPHRVLQRRGALKDRLSFPYFFDPCFDEQMMSFVPLMLESGNEDYMKYCAAKANDTTDRVKTRWDRQDPSMFEGTYGEYLMRKVSKAFPQLAETQLA